MVVGLVGGGEDLVSTNIARRLDLRLGDWVVGNRTGANQA